MTERGEFTPTESDSLVEELRSKHQPVSWGAGEQCRSCAGTWPCAPTRAATRIESLQEENERLKEAEARTYEAAWHQLKRLELENERLREGLRDVRERVKHTNDGITNVGNMPWAVASFIDQLLQQPPEQP